MQTGKRVWGFLTSHMGTVDLSIVSRSSQKRSTMYWLDHSHHPEIFSMRELHPGHGFVIRSTVVRLHISSKFRCAASFLALSACCTSLSCSNIARSSSAASLSRVPPSSSVPSDVRRGLAEPAASNRKRKLSGSACRASYSPHVRSWCQGIRCWKHVCLPHCKHVMMGSLLAPQ